MGALFPDHMVQRQVRGLSWEGVLSLPTDFDEASFVFFPVQQAFSLFPDFS